MDTVQKNITRYFRDAVVAQMTDKLDITDESIKLKYSTVKTGQISPDGYQYLMSLKPSRGRSDDEALDFDMDNTAEKYEKSIKVIIAVQVVNVKSEGGVKYNSQIDDLTGTFFLPAHLSEAGILSPRMEVIPWIPRKYLSPMEDDVLIVGDIRDVDAFIVSRAWEIRKITNTGRWEDYIAFAEQFWKAVNETKFNSVFIYNFVHGKQPLALDDYVYIIPDNTVVTTHHIQKLYEYSLTGDQPDNKLYKKLTSITAQPARPLIDGTIKQMKKHAGQMNGLYSLSPSQRVALNHFASSADGDILAVNGPPGTGKTTLIQSVVADLMVRRALNMEEPPVIVATSTNNQAVRNIIDSFQSKDFKEHPKKLNTHWIRGKTAFASYLPSKSGVDKALDKGYQVTDRSMGYIAAQWEEENNKQNSKHHVIDYCRNLFGADIRTLRHCINRLHNMLCDFDTRRRRMLDLAAEIPFVIDVLPVDIRQNIFNMEQHMDACRRNEREYKRRLDEWGEFWNKTKLLRMFKFIPHIKNRLNHKISNFRILDEDLPENDLTIEMIEEYYDNKLSVNRIQYNGYETAVELLKTALPFEDAGINVFDTKDDTIALSINTLNDIFD